jgi:hypothetical protein
MGGSRVWTVTVRGCTVQPREQLFQGLQIRDEVHLSPLQTGLLPDAEAVGHHGVQGDIEKLGDLLRGLPLLDEEATWISLGLSPMCPDDRFLM